MMPLPRPEHPEPLRQANVAAYVPPRLRQQADHFPVNDLINSQKSQQDLLNTIVARLDEQIDGNVEYQSDQHELLTTIVKNMEKQHSALLKAVSNITTELQRGFNTHAAWAAARAIQLGCGEPFDGTPKDVSRYLHDLDIHYAINPLSFVFTETKVLCAVKGCAPDTARRWAYAWFQQHNVATPRRHSNIYTDFVKAFRLQFETGLLPVTTRRFETLTQTASVLEYSKEYERLCVVENKDHFPGFDDDIQYFALGLKPEVMAKMQLRPGYDFPAEYVRMRRWALEAEAELAEAAHAEDELAEDETAQSVASADLESLF
jgi:hypothetical protein